MSIHTRKYTWNYKYPYNWIDYCKKNSKLHYLFIYLVKIIWWKINWYISALERTSEFCYFNAFTAPSVSEKSHTWSCQSAIAEWRHPAFRVERRALGFRGSEPTVSPCRCPLRKMPFYNAHHVIKFTAAAEAVWG